MAEHHAHNTARLCAGPQLTTVVSITIAVSGKRAATRAAADDDDVEALVHTPAPLEADAAVHDAAIREDGGCGEIARARAHGAPRGDCQRGRLFCRRRRYGRIQLRELGRIVHRAEIDRRSHRTRAHSDD